MLIEDKITGIRYWVIATVEVWNRSMYICTGNKWFYVDSEQYEIVEET